MIYLDNAATTQRKPDCVIEAVCNAMRIFGNSGRGAHEGSLAASRDIYGLREKLGLMFGYPASRVCFTNNSTTALNIAINGLIGHCDHVITTDCEHNSVLRPLYRLQNAGTGLSFVRADSKGRINYDDFRALINNRTRAIVCTHASNLTGNVFDIERIGAIAREHGLLFILDASQTAGIFPIDAKKCNIDVLCFTGHKGMMGPQGTGGLCVREGLKVGPLYVGGTGIKTYSKTHPEDMPTALEAGTLNGHGLCGLDAAVDFINRHGMGTIREHEQHLASMFYMGVRDIEGVTVYGDFSTSERSAIVALNVNDCDSASVADELSQNYSIATRAGGHCAPRMHEALGTHDRGAVRFSFSYFNTKEEVETAISAIREIAME